MRRTELLGCGSHVCVCVVCLGAAQVLASGSDVPAMPLACAGSGQDQGWREDQVRPPVGRDANEKPQSLVDMLPEWVGYSFLYLVSIVPVLIAGSVVAILFFSSLK
jgi:hypothetical protein